MATEYIDGPIELDSFTSTIAGQVYIFNNAVVTPAVLMAERNDEKGRLAGKRTQDDPGRDTLTGEVQIDITAKMQKLMHEEFIVADVDHYDGVATTYVIEGETAPSTANESRTRGFTARRILTQPA